MKPALSPRQKTLTLLLAAIAFRAIIPVGYMPGSPGSGLLFELCPDGMPSAFVQALGGHHHHSSDSGETTPHSFDQCTVGHAIGSAAINSSAAAALSSGDDFEFITSFLRVIAATPRAAYSSRAPPVFK